jgi:hypothetical protein
MKVWIFCGAFGSYAFRIDVPVFNTPGLHEKLVFTPFTTVRRVRPRECVSDDKLFMKR